LKRGDDFVVLYSVYILERLSGRSIFTKNYGKIKVDENLLSGFMSALFGFSESELEDTGIENIDMGGIRWVYVDEKELLFISASSKEDEPDMLKNQLHLVCDAFCERYAIKESFNEMEWNGNVKMFDPFAQVLDSLIESWEAAKKVKDAALLMDLLDVFQSVIQAFAQNVDIDEEYKNLNLVSMAFDQETGSWDMDKLANVDPEMLRERLTKILTNFVMLVKDTMKNDDLYREILHRKIYPIIKREWARIRQGKIDDFIIHLLL